MIKKIIRCLKTSSEVNDWLISENEVNTSEAFYVLQNLETTRKTNTIEYKVTIYKEFKEENKEYLGSSSFIVSHKMTIKEINKKIDEAIFAAKFVKNEKYEIVNKEFEKKKNFKEKPISEKPLELLDNIAFLFFKESNDVVKFNAFEAFYKETSIHIINSKGVDLKKTLYSIMVEAIPSYNGENQKVEVYKSYNYSIYDENKIESDAKEAVSDATSRYFAQTINFDKKMDIILKNNEVYEFAYNIINDYSYATVYRGATDKKIGDEIQKNIKGDSLTIGIKANSKANAFDNDGTICKPCTVVEDGKLVNFYGNNQYAYYLGKASTGVPSMITLKNGKKSILDIKKKPYIEIISLSGIQIDMYSNYIGGEVRLANYFDGKKVTPISGFSFSGNIEECLSNLVISKEKVVLQNYEGPKYIKLSNIEIL